MASGSCLAAGTIFAREFYTSVENTFTSRMRLDSVRKHTGREPCQV
jgi:hypothetical protein